MRLKKQLIFLGIFVLALLLRIVNLNSVPYGFHVDEAKAAWNSFSILRTGHDDHGKFLPLYYDSFGDFRPTGIIYSIIFTKNNSFLRLIFSYKIRLYL